MASVFAEACASGMAGEDWAVGQYKMAQQMSKPAQNPYASTTGN
jgi:hypothetical protein